MADKDTRHVSDISGRPSERGQATDMSGCAALAFNAAGIVIGGTAGFLAAGIEYAPPAAFAGYIGAEIINAVRAYRAPKP